MEPATEGSISVIVGLVLIVALVLANAFFVAAEFALVGARKTRLDELARAGDRKATLARRAVQSLDRYISATQLGITLSSLGLGWIGEPALAHVIDGGFAWLPVGAQAIATHGVAVAIAFTIITVLHIILGELVPKAIALLYPEEVSGWLAAPLMAFTWVMAGPIKILNGTANRLLRWGGVRRAGRPRAGPFPRGDPHAGGAEPPRAASLESQDARLLEGVFEFSEKNAEDVMTPRTEMEAIEADLLGGGGRRRRGGRATLAVSGLRGLARRDRRRGARQGHPHRHAPGTGKRCRARSCARPCSSPAPARSRTSWPT